MKGYKGGIKKMGKTVVTYLPSDFIVDYYTKRGSKRDDGVFTTNILTADGFKLINMYDVKNLTDRITGWKFIGLYKQYSEEIYKSLKELQKYVKCKESPEELMKLEEDEIGMKLYRRSIRNDKKAFASILSEEDDLAKLKKIYQWKYKEQKGDVFYIDRVEQLEAYFMRFVKNKNDEESQKLLQTYYPYGVISLIEKVLDVAFLRCDVGDGQTFNVIGGADIITRDTLYMLTSHKYDVLWGTIYLNILNIIYKKPFLTILRRDDSGVLYERNIYTFNCDEENRLLELCKKCVQTSFDKREIDEFIEDYRFLWKWEFDEKQDERREVKIDLKSFGVDSFLNFDDLDFRNDKTGEVKKLIQADTLSFLNKIISFNQEPAFRRFYERLGVFGKLIDALIKIQTIVGDEAWEAIVKTVATSSGYEPIIGFSSFLFLKASQSEIFERIYKRLASDFPHFFKREENKPFILARADYRKVNLELMLNIQQRKELDNFLKSEKFLGKLKKTYEEDEFKKRCLYDKHVLKKDVDSQYFCEDDYTGDEFSFINELNCEIEVEEASFYDRTGAITKVIPCYYLKDNGNIAPRIDVTCQICNGAYLEHVLRFSFTLETPHKVLSSFFQSFGIESCTYDFDDWIGRRATMLPTAEGKGLPALVHSLGIEERMCDIIFLKPCEN